MADNYVGLTIRTEVLEEDGVTVDIDTLKKIAVEAMKYYYKYTRKKCPEINNQRLLPDNLCIEEYDVKPEGDLRIKLSLESENYAPFNCWMEADCPDSKEWLLLIDLARHLSGEFPNFTFNVSSSFFRKPNCAEEEKYTNLFKKGTQVGQLTRQEWVERYLGVKYLRERLDGENAHKQGI